MFMKKAVGILSSILACVIAVNAVVPVWSETIRQNGKDTASSDTDGYSTQDLSYTPETVPDYYDEDMTDTGILTSHKSKKIAEPVGAGAWDGTSVFQDGIIYIKTYEQLSKIGTDTEVKSGDFASFGTGERYAVSGDGTEEDPYVYQTYSNDAVYYLVNDIAMPSGTRWTVPSGFTGYFTSDDANGEDNSVLRTADTRLYESVSGISNNDKVYCHNVFQLNAKGTDKIKNTDYDVLSFGSGSDVGTHYYNNINKDYILAENFTAKTTFDVTEYKNDAVDSQGNIVTAIVIRTYDQLKLAGLGEQPLKTDTFHNIDRVQTVNYPPNAVYYLANDITLADDGWQLPADFTGSFTCDPTGKEEDSKRLYNRQTASITRADIYIQNIYQLEILGMSNDARSEEPVLDKDYDPVYVGAGSPIYLTNVSTDYLTYKNTNTYILSRTFSSNRVDQISTTALGMIANSDHIDGRDFFGQTTVEINGDAYILIGDRQQLDAIGTNKYVYDPVYAVTQTRSGITDTWKIDESRVSLVYPGDADLIAGVSVNTDGTSVQDFSTASLFNTTDYHSLGAERESTTERVVYCASDGKGGYNIRGTSANANRGSQRYTTDAKYIVFRDINMNNTDKTDKQWQPLMFSGEMIGAKAAASTDVSTLWSEGKTLINSVSERKPVISNINVQPATLTQLGETRLDLSKQTGVGFFGTLSGKFNSSSFTHNPVVVKNIKLKDGTVNNPAVKADIDETLISGTVSGLATVLGKVLDPVLKVLIGKNVGVESMLNGLLNARKKDPTSLATGSFAGRIIGKATVEDCEVENISVTTVKTKYEEDSKIVGKGGFVGHVEGVTKYDGLSNTLGVVGTALESVLNIIPGLGLGDLITVLLDNALPLENLIPTGYARPEIKNSAVNSCTLSDENGKIGVGGFAGSLTGTTVADCSVKNCSNLTVKADQLGGGFAGVTRDAIIKGTLSGLGVEVAEALHPQSELIRCAIESSDISVEGGSYLGGFSGALANSYGINDTIDAQSSVKVSGTGDYAGGFTGYAMLGTLFGMGSYLVDSSDLLGTVKGLVTGLLGSGSNQELLDLGGVAPSAIMGCQINGDLTVAAQGSYAGGIVGRGNGVMITSSSETNLKKLPKYKKETAVLPIDTATEARNNYVASLKNNDTNGEPPVSVYAGQKYAGGIAGYLTSANVGGLLGDTAGIGQFLGFTVSNTTVHGANGGFSVEAGNDFAGGGIGWAVGGDVLDTKVEELLSVKAHNRAAGFVGATGPGDLGSGEGLDVSLLGISLLKIDNLLSLVSGVKTTYKRADVTGVNDGFTVEQTGTKLGDSSGVQASAYTAGGYAAEANSVTVTDCHVNNLLSVKANDSEGIAGGFVAHSEAGGLAGLVEESTTLDAVKINDLLGAVPYLVPKYNGCDVNYVTGGFVSGDTAGGFTGDFRSGYVNTETVEKTTQSIIYEQGYEYQSGIPTEAYAVYNISRVDGKTYAGGFGGKVYSGSLASAGGGVSILSDHRGSNTINVRNLLDLVNSYVPMIRYAGVYTPGFTVTATEVVNGNQFSGSAGGFIGYASGAQISHSNVNRLVHTAVKAPNNLETVYEPSDVVNESPYYTESTYAVTGGHYAGGYFGAMDIGDAASLGGGINALGNLIDLNNVLSVLNVVVTTVEHSDVEGAPGGFSVFSDGTDSSGKVGMSGGFSGANYGGHIQNSHCKNFYYIVGQETAGGYVGRLQPGSVAKLLEGQSSLIGSLLNTDGALADLINSFVPTIRNSTTTCVPCGGAVRADAPSDAAYQRGCAGGYCGHNNGGNIWGNNDATWMDQNDRLVAGYDFGHDREGNYTGEKHECAAYRIRSVYGYEYAGGFTGFMESANLADAGSVSLLQGLLGDRNILSVTNLLGALKTVYPTEENTAVYGPLRNLDVTTWNNWVTYVGKYHGYGLTLAREGNVADQAALDAIIGKYIYGYNAVAGRSVHSLSLASEGGDAGGYIGLMISGKITNGQAYDTKLVKSFRNTGGYAGSMQTGGAAELGGANLLGMQLDLGQLVSALKVFVPVINSGTAEGYQSGLTVTCTGNDFINNCGYAGGYVGSAYGAQIWGNKKFGDSDGTGCDVKNLRYVKGNNAAGGYAGLTKAASAANVNTNASKGLLQGILNSIISNAGSVASVIEATITTVYNARVSADNSSFGFTVDGYDGVHPKNAGGFAGVLEATWAGNKDFAVTENRTCDLVVNNLRSVDGRFNAGGFFGLADVNGIAEVSGEGETSILGRALSVGEVSLVDVFRPKVYFSEVNGVADGFTVNAYESDSQGTLDETRYSGCAGGFGGAMMNGVVNDSKVTALSTVSGLNYTGGFIGHMGKSGVVDADNANVLGLIGLTAGVADIFSTHTERCNVTGIDAGAVIRSEKGTEPISGGFTGYADVSKITGCHVDNLKQVYSDEIAGGFVGKTDMHYLISVEGNSILVRLVQEILNGLLGLLYVPELEHANVLSIDILGLENVLQLNVLSDGDLLYVNLLGLRIGVSLVKATEEGDTDTAIITIGDSTVALPCTEDGFSSSDPNVVVNLIKGNRTRVDSCSVKGIADGYDVYGGKASNTTDGSGEKGYAGGFAGYNNEGKFISDDMVYCDVVRGTAQKVGPFSGGTSLQSVYSFNTLESIEKVSSKENTYHVYRNTNLTHALTSGNDEIAQAVADEGTSYKRFDITHLAAPIVPGENESYEKIYGKWNGAKLASDDKGANAALINVYVSSAKADLMLDTPTYANSESLVPNPGETKDPCGNIDLTIQKIWNDNSNKDKSRPDSIKVRIWQHWLNTDGTPVMDGTSEKTVLYKDSAVIPGVDNTDGWFEINSTLHGRAGSATWTRVISGLPAYAKESGNDYYFSYTIEEAPILGYTGEITYDESGSTATIVNTPAEFEIQFKYYDRYQIDGKPAGISSEETAYTITTSGVPAKFIQKSEGVESYDFSGFIGEKAVEFSDNALGVTNVMCDYDLWTSQSAAVSGMANNSYFVGGNPVEYTADERIYHTDYLGKPYDHENYSGQADSKEEKWVNYYDSKGNAYVENTENIEESLQAHYRDIRKIVVWCYNYPKQYNVDIFGTFSEEALIEKTVGNNKVYVVKKDYPRNQTYHGKFYYNQRFRGESGNDAQDDAGFIEKYGFPAYTNVYPADYTKDAIDDYSFAYWAYDQEGTQIASVDIDFGYRVTKKTELYAVYASSSSGPGFSISANSNDTFVDSNGVSKTRLNIWGSVYGAPDYDKNVKKVSFINVSLSTQIRDNPEVYTPKKINELFEHYKNQLKEIVEKHDNTTGSHPFSSAESYYKTVLDEATGEYVYEKAIDAETGQEIVDEDGNNVKVLDLTLTTKGFIYTVVSNGNEKEKPDDAVANLTNKNRAHFTATYKTSALNVNNTGSNGNTCLMYCGALKYGNDWSVSTNCLIYYNGHVVSNIADAWE